MPGRIYRRDDIWLDTRPDLTLDWIWRKAELGTRLNLGITD